MGLKVLSIVESAYRATLEEQDDTIVWICTAMAGGGADLAVLLRGNAVNYAVRGQDASGLSFGAKAQTQPPKLADDVARLVDKGVPVYLVKDDAAERGVMGEVADGITPIARSEVPALMGEFDQIWHW